MNASDMEFSSHDSASALHAPQLHADAERVAITSVAAQLLESPPEAKDQFESLLESIYASIACSPQGGASRAHLGVEVTDVLHEIYKAHET